MNVGESCTHTQLQKKLKSQLYITSVIPNEEIDDFSWQELLKFPAKTHRKGPKDYKKNMVGICLHFTA